MGTMATNAGMDTAQGWSWSVLVTMGIMLLWVHVGVPALALITSGQQNSLPPYTWHILPTLAALSVSACPTPFLRS